MRKIKIVILTVMLTLATIVILPMCGNADNNDGLILNVEAADYDFYYGGSVVLNKTKIIQVSSGGLAAFTFTPDTTNSYTLTASSQHNLIGIIFDSDTNLIADNINLDNSSDLLLSGTLEAGKMYFIGIGFYSETESGAISFKLTKTSQHSHFYGAWSTIESATCISSGTQQRRCTVCGNVETRTTPALGHSYSSTYITDKAATCTSGGSKSRHCTRCGAKTDVTTIPAKGHSYGSWSSTKKATCTASGKKQRKCSACGAVETQTLKAFGHKFKTTTTKATITKNGKIVKTCSVCKKTFTTTIPMAKTVKLSKTTYTYNGKAQKPDVTVKDSKGKALKNGTDYSVSYPSGRKNPGTYKVKITFKGNYNGTKTLSFKISVGKVTGLKQIKKSGYKLAMEWKKVPGATDYEIQKYDSKKKKWVKIGNSKSVKIGFKKAKGTNKFRIKARVKINGKTYYGAYSSTLTTKS